MFEPSGVQASVEPGPSDQIPSVKFEDLSSRLLSLQRNENSLSDNNPSSLKECISEMPANYSRNNNQQQVNQKVIQQVSTDQKHLFFQQADLYSRYESRDGNSKPTLHKVSKVPSVTDLTFFDLSNPGHLNKLFSRLEDI